MYSSFITHKTIAARVRILLTAALAAPALLAQTETAEKNPPLPLHSVEGTGGILATQSAYIVNAPRNNEPIGRPSLGFAYVDVGQGKSLAAATLTVALHERIEFGYAYDKFNLGDLPKDIALALGINVGEDHVVLHNFNLRFQLLKENEFNKKWLPAITFGVSYKYNADIDSIDGTLGGALNSVGIKKDSGIDYTLYASKLVSFGKLPVLFNLGVRATKAAHIGLLGFTDDYSVVFEGNVVAFVAPGWAIAAEYRQKPKNEYSSIPGLVENENDWWTLAVAHVVSKHATIAAGYGHFGKVLNGRANGVWAVSTKFEF